MCRCSTHQLPSGALALSKAVTVLQFVFCNTPQQVECNLMQRTYLVHLWPSNKIEHEVTKVAFVQRHQMCEQ